MKPLNKRLYPSMASKQQGEEIRQQIVSAANRLFYEQGYNHTSFSEIAEAAAVPRGNFYYYFKSKDDMLEDEFQRFLLDCPPDELEQHADAIVALKYFFKEKDRYRLQPANPTMKPIFVKKSEPLEIKGKVVMVIRRMNKPLPA